MTERESQQVVLDPRSVKAERVWTPSGPISPAMRQFGAFPNVSLWKPGDVILLSEVAPGRVARAIINAQLNSGYATENAQWHNAVVYLGNGLICELVAGGVRATQLQEYVRTCMLRVRRDLELETDMRWAIAMNALTMAQIRNTVVDTVVNAIQGFLGTAGAISSAGIISNGAQLYADAYAIATGRVLRAPGKQFPMQGITPAFLTIAGQLSDVPSEWLRLEREDSAPPASGAANKDAGRSNTAALTETSSVLNAYSALQTEEAPDSLQRHIDELERLKPSSPVSRPLHIVLGRLYRSLGDYNRAIAVLTDFLAQKEKAGESGDKDAAIALYNRACYWVQLGVGAEKEKQNSEFGKALVDLTEALRISPELTSAASEDADFAPLGADATFRHLTGPTVAERL